MRVRLRYQKLGKVRFTSHRDVARLVERALRRVDAPVALSEGFVARPKLHFGLALPTGASSVAEYLDVDLVDDAPVDLDALPEALSAALPPGLDVSALGVLHEKGASLQAAVVACTWELTVAAPSSGDLSSWTNDLLDADELVVTRERKGKQVEDDLRPALLDLRVVGPLPADRHEVGGVVVAELATKPRGVRPAELLAVGDRGLVALGVCRLNQWIELDGARQEPLPPATRAPHAQARAS
jgi:radical SAM-linked protein